MLTSFIVALAIAVTSSALGDSYSTEATLTLSKASGQYEVIAQICRLIERNGEIIEEVISRPRVVSTPGVPGSFFVGASKSDKNYHDQENVTMDVFWPKKATEGFARCTVIVRRGDVILSKTSMKVHVAAE